MKTYLVATTSKLDIAYLEWNPQGRQTAVLLHGCPPDTAGPDKMIVALHPLMFPRNSA